jgi:CheY-like chemotaxis protein
MPCSRYNQGNRRRGVTQRRPLRILYADDDDEIREIIRRLLVCLGYSVKTVSSGQKALKLFPKEHFDLLVTDQDMPEMSSISLAMKIKEIQPKSPVVLLKNWDARLIQSSENCIDSILTEPLTIQELQRGIDNAVFRSYQKEGKPGIV